MAFLFNFGLSQEDERTEAAALRLERSDRVLAVASAGDMPLSLLALGAARVDAVDLDERQVWLTLLKHAAVMALDREDAIGFLGLMPMPGARRLALFPVVAAGLPDLPRRFFSRAAPALARGVVWAGRYERYVRWLARIAVPLIGRRHLAALFDCATPEDQVRLYDAHIGTARLRAIFRLAFHPRLFASRGIDPRSLRHRSRSGSLGDQYLASFRALCTATPAATNHLLQLPLLGRVLSSQAVPAYLTVAGATELRARPEALRVHCRDLATHLNELGAGTFDKVHLSNLGDWLDQPGFEEVLRLVVRRVARPARVVWRFLHVDRPLPADIASDVRIDHELGRALRASDRFPFYAVVPAAIGAGAAP